MKTFRLDDIDLRQHWDSEDDYEKQLKKLQTRMADLQTACYHNQERVIIVLEGWDASGKGGAIRRLREKLDPRSYRVYPIGAPDHDEQKEHYLQRFWNKLPPKGHIAIFDRSWYGRVLVERIEGFADKDAWQRGYGEINDFEKMLADDGVVVIKLLLHISQEEQLKRYAERLENPKKHWKLTPDDLRNRERAKDYQEAYEDMLEKTHKEHAPWYTIAAEYKWFARTAVLKTVCERLEKCIDTRIPAYSSEEIAETRRLLGLDQK